MLLLISNDKYRMHRARRKNFEYLIVENGFEAEVYELGYYQADEEGFWEN